MNKSSGGSYPLVLPITPNRFVVPSFIRPHIRVGGTLGEAFVKLIHLILGLGENDPNLVLLHYSIHELGNVNSESDRCRCHGRDFEEVVADLGLVGGGSQDTSGIRQSRFKKETALVTNRQTPRDIDFLDSERSQLLDFRKLSSERSLTQDLMSLIDNQTNHSVFHSVPVTMIVDESVAQLADERKTHLQKV